MLIKTKKYLDDIIFTDEATFNINGCINKHNKEFWKPTCNFCELT